MPGRPIVMFIHGRDMAYTTNEGLERLYDDAFDRGLAQVRAQTGISDLDVPHVDRRLVNYQYIYQRDYATACGGRLAVADSDALANLGAARAQLSALTGDLASVDRWITAAGQQVSERTRSAGGRGTVIGQAGISVLAMTNSTLHAQLDEAGYVEAELRRTAADLRAAGRRPLSDRTRDLAAQLAALAVELRSIDSAVTGVASGIGSVPDTMPTADGTPTVVRAAPSGAKEALTRAEHRLSVRMTALAPVVQAVDEASGTLTATVYTGKPADWTEIGDGTVRWLTTVSQQLPGGSDISDRFLIDVRRYLGQWPYRCATNRLLLDSLYRARQERRPIVLVAHGVGALVAYGTLYALDAGGAPDDLQVAALITLGAPLGVPDIMTALVGRFAAAPYPYPSRVATWIAARGPHDPMATDAATRVFDISSGRPLRDLVTPADGRAPHSVASYLGSVEVARAIAAAWCGAFGEPARAARPAGCERLVQGGSGM